jgi:hypothetical protein
MTDQEKIEALSEALNNLYQSADQYIEDGSYLGNLLTDIDRAQAVLRQIPPKSWNLGG